MNAFVLSQPPQKKSRLIGHCIPFKKAKWWKEGGSPKVWMKELPRQYDIIVPNSAAGGQQLSAYVSSDSLPNYKKGTPNNCLSPVDGDATKRNATMTSNHLNFSSNHTTDISTFVRRAVGKQMPQASIQLKNSVPMNTSEPFQNRTYAQEQQIASQQPMILINDPEKHGQEPNKIVDDDCSIDGSTMSGESGALNFRAYQAERWTGKFEELTEFCEQYGHCLVPNSFPQNPALAQWVKRQRYQYKVKFLNKRSTMSDERVQALEEIGFVWDSHRAVWDERLQELLEYKRVKGHCNVPSRYSAHQLAVWVKRQRRQYKFCTQDKPSSMTLERIHRLEAIGFEWDLRKGNEDDDEV